MKTSKKIVFYLVILVLLAVFLYCAFQITAYIKEGIDNRALRDELAEMAVVIDEPQETDKSAGLDKTDEQADPSREEKVNISVDFAKLKETNEDIVAWLYCEDTVINYPVAQAEDND